MAKCNVGTRVTYLLAGIGIGAIVALLFAPQSGEETRQQIADKVGDGKDFVTTKSREIQRQAENLVDQGKDLVSKQKARLADVLDSGKQKVRETFTQ